MSTSLLPNARIRQEGLHRALIAALLHAHNTLQRCSLIAARHHGHNTVQRFHPAAASEIFEEARKLCEMEWPNSEDGYRILNQGIESFRERVIAL